MGIDENGRVVMAMPDERNYGYWTDNNLKKEDFESLFTTAHVAKERFDQLWAGFKRKKA